MFLTTGIVFLTDEMFDGSVHNAVHSKNIFLFLIFL
jgi:hypothetical protein